MLDLKFERVLDFLAPEQLEAFDFRDSLDGLFVVILIETLLVIKRQNRLVFDPFVDF